MASLGRGRTLGRTFGGVGVRDAARAVRVLSLDLGEGQSHGWGEGRGARGVKAFTKTLLA